MALSVFVSLILFFSPAFANTTASPAALEQQLAQNPDNVKVRTRLAKHYLAESKFDKVIELLNAYTDQLSAEAFRILAFSYSGKNDHANEVRILNLLVAKNEEEYRAHMLLAQAYFKLATTIAEPKRQHDTLTLGIQRLRKTLQLSPKYKPAFDLLLKTFLSQKANNEARELIMEGIEKFGHRPELFRELCKLDSMDGYLPQAVKNCTESISLSRDYPDHYVYLMQTYHDQKEDKKAEKVAVQAGKKFPNSEFVQWASGRLFLERKNYPVASRYFKAAIRAKADSGRAQFGLAQALFEQGDHENALEPFSKACRWDMSTVDAFFAAAGRLKQSGNAALGAKFQQAANLCKP